jgi:hypothetical protein
MNFAQGMCEGVLYDHEKRQRDILSYNFPGRAEENHEGPQSG